MTKINSIVNLKGGVAKTYSTICVATALAGMRTVGVWDADPQGTATDWAEEAADSGDPLPFEVEIVNEVMLNRLARRASTDYVLIDTPPGHPRIIDEAIKLADFVILPSSPAVPDLRRLLASAESIPEYTPYAALLTRVKKHTIAYKAAVEFLHNHPEVPVFSQAIGDRQAIQNSFGTRPDVFYDYSAITDELLEVLE